MSNLVLHNAAHPVQTALCFTQSVPVKVKLSSREHANMFVIHFH
jgi:hypothetical protein